ncbi:uncharacterized protein MONOS_724 [Monocercomonoides exilis]|uniref:uncharacterized protein n=1 Tax=Monocercomonoides exilis TaxID=2049356 RepID=UPI00355987D2|nr:hypothetical protein MONOS_724 [Monocercomonoides exilis]|eukprot:MONOS_724.1-p1 / transcript=MONOS_724.1 / gene=MONOS_724 / organism=Monocercomonoides_exilis_PA203 / gene_product=unspecified product / transcript_product=unspecified product / location=Mono_scaffold00012:97124-97788(-) / protein_length=184 / sequence_SO=supercontig / SO=protein_coding / is_pseudo=false
MYCVTVTAAFETRRVRCIASAPFGHNVYFEDYYSFFLSNNPFYESFTTKSNEKRVCRNYNGQYTEKKWWLKEGMKDGNVGVNGDDSNDMFAMSESAPCKTVGHAVGESLAQLSSTITALSGRHVSEGEMIIVGEKISVVGIVEAVSVIGTNTLSSSSTKLFNVSNRQFCAVKVVFNNDTSRRP